MLCLYVKVHRSVSSLPDRTWSSVFTHRAPRPCSVTADCGYLADIGVARHVHRHLGGTRPPVAGGPKTVKRQPPGILEPPCGRLFTMARV